MEQQIIKASIKINNTIIFRSIINVLSSVDGRKRVLALLSLVIGFAIHIFPSISPYTDQVLKEIAYIFDTLGTVLGTIGIIHAYAKQGITETQPEKVENVVTP